MRDVFVCHQSLCHSFGFMNVWVGAGEPVLPLASVAAHVCMKSLGLSLS